MTTPATTLLGFLLGWALVTLLYTVAITIEAPQFFVHLIPGVGVVSGGYITIFGVPAYLLSKGIGLRDNRSYPLVGLVASLPMLVLSLYGGSILLAATTIAAGIGFGFVFRYFKSTTAPNQKTLAE